MTHGKVCICRSFATLGRRSSILLEQKYRELMCVPVGANVCIVCLCVLYMLVSVCVFRGQHWESSSTPLHLMF